MTAYITQVKVFKDRGPELAERECNEWLRGNATLIEVQDIKYNEGSRGSSILVIYKRWAE